MLYFSRGQKIILIVLITALLAGLGALLYGRGRLSALEPEQPFFVDSPQDRAPAVLLVDIQGAVKKPGVYSLKSGARVNDALVQAGGATPQADLEAVNLAAGLRDGQKLEIPQKTVEFNDNSSHRTSTSGPKQLPKKPIPLNTAGVAQFQQLPGIGPVLAERIVQYRKQLKVTNGQGFQSKEQLLEVPGIGPKKYAELMNYVRL
jgi:competence protein ComEA